LTPEEVAVVEALKIFKSQADECIACLYTYLTIHVVAGKDKHIGAHVQRNALFWGTTLRALQTSLILALGRVFETDTPHNLGTFMRVVKQNRAAFSRHALRNRKAGFFSNNQTALDSYVKEAKIPSRSDFRRVANFVKAHRRSYLLKYRDLRDKVFAHTLVVSSNEITKLFSKTNIRELQRMTTYLGRLHDGVLSAFQDGGRITVGPRRYSVAKMLKHPKGRAAVKAIQEDVVSHTRQAMQPWTPLQRERSVS
jgi:HEPN superfamily AbiU2-like protein